MEISNIQISDLTKKKWIYGLLEKDGLDILAILKKL